MLRRMETQLGTFEGRRVQASKLMLNGSTTDRIGHMDLDEEIYLVVKARVASISHGETKVHKTDLFTRTQQGKIEQMFVVDRDEGEAMLSDAAQKADERFGVKNLFSGDDEDDERDDDAVVADIFDGPSVD